MKMIEKFLKNNKGFSLIELLVTVAIMVIVSGGVAAVVISATRNYGRGNSEIDLQQEVQTVTNILNNRVIESKRIVETDEHDGIIITTTDSKEIRVWSESNFLYYNDGEQHVISKYINSDEGVAGFVAKVLSKNDEDNSEFTTPTVMFSLAFKTPDGREMSTTFTSTSRNAKASDDEVAASVVFISDSEFVIEPNQSIKIPYKVLLSGGLSVKLDESNICPEMAPNSTISFSRKEFGNDPDGDPDPSADEWNYIDFYAEPNEGINSSDLNLNISWSGIKDGNTISVNRIITIHVRRVKSNPTVLIKYNESKSGHAGAYTEDSYYDIVSNVMVSNPDRFYVTSTDDDWISPYYMRYIFTASDNIRSEGIDKYVEVYVGDSKKAWSSFFDVAPDESIGFKLKKEMPEKSFISVTTIATHASFNDADPVGPQPLESRTAINKTNGKYAYYSGSAKIERRNIFTFGGFRRGGMKNSDYWSDYHDVKDIYEMLVNDYYLNYLCSNAEISDEKIEQMTNDYNNGGGRLAEGSQSYKEITTVLRENCRFGVFYSIGSEEISNEEKNNYNPLSNDYYWSQYRILPGSTNSMQYRFDEDMSRRFEPDKQYSIEMVFVIYTDGGCSLLDGEYVIDPKTILYPRYDKLMELGFGETKIVNGRIHLGADYSFDEGANVDYNFIKNVPVGISEIRFKDNQNSSALSKSFGSESDPVEIAHNTSLWVYYDQGTWIGTGYNEYENVLGGILQIKTDNIGWTNYSSTISGLTEDNAIWPEADPYFGTSDKFCGAGNFKIKAENKCFRIMYDYIQDNAKPKLAPFMDANAEFRILCQFRNLAYNYILDSDGVFGATQFRVSPGHNYNLYSLDSGNEWGTIYFKTIKEGDIKPYMTMYYDFNDGTEVEKEFIWDQNQRPTYPAGGAGNHSVAGKTFDGWYTAKTGGTRLYDNVANQFYNYGTGNWDARVLTLYAHWK